MRIVPVTSPRRTALLLIGIVLAGWALRLALLHGYPLREDEAIYAFWARAAWSDPWYLSTWPDKPPLFLWAQALALRLFGETAPGARVVSLLASTLTIPLVAAGARRLWPAQPGGAGVLAAALMALSPFAISFASTGYTDSMLVLWGVLALVLVLHGRPLAAGLALGAAIMTKQQGLLFLPLIGGVQWLSRQEPSPGRVWARIAAGLALVVVPLLIWDAARWGTAPSPWDLGVRNYGALAIAPLAALPLRLQEWGALLYLLAATPWAWLLIGATVAAALALDRSGRTPVVLALPAWGLAFVAFHLFTTLQPWDRYLLPLAPMLALLVAGAAARLPLRGPALPVAALLLLLVLAPPAVTAARGGYPVGADHGDLAGLDDLFARIESQDVPAILYHRTLGWQARFALAHAVEEGRVELRWFPHAVYLADNAAKAPHKARYLIEPLAAPAPELPLQLATRGLVLAERARKGNFVLYEIVARSPARSCDWCLCRPRAGRPHRRRR